MIYCLQIAFWHQCTPVSREHVGLRDTFTNTGNNWSKQTLRFSTWQLTQYKAWCLPDCLVRDHGDCSNLCLFYFTFLTSDSQQLAWNEGQQSSYCHPIRQPGQPISAVSSQSMISVIVSMYENICVWQTGVLWVSKVPYKRESQTKSFLFLVDDNCKPLYSASIHSLIICLTFARTGRKRSHTLVSGKGDSIWDNVISWMSFLPSSSVTRSVWWLFCADPFISLLFHPFKKSQ